MRVRPMKSIAIEFGVHSLRVNKDLTGACEKKAPSPLVAILVDQGTSRQGQFKNCGDRLPTPTTSH